MRLFLRTIGLAFILYICIDLYADNTRYAPKAAQWEAFERQVSEIRTNNKGMLLP